MTDYHDRKELQALTLGQTTGYAAHYSPQLLQAVPRALNREELSTVKPLSFSGHDIWHGYELSWLNKKGKPLVALARFTVDSASPNIVESKSFKLYLNSFNQTRFESREKVRQTMVTDLSAVAGVVVDVELFTAQQTKAFPVTDLPGECIDNLDIDVDGFELNPHLLQTTRDQAVVQEVLHSHLLKSNCLITNQPDWASVIIQYHGPQIQRESLLRYLISFRLHNEFHEQCVERIFADIQRHCSPTILSVQALYTRRGGLDINPFRTSEQDNIAPLYRINRQ